MTLGSVCHVSTITIFKELFNLNVTILSTGAEQNLCLKKVHVHVLTPVSALYMYVTQQKLELLKEHVTNLPAVLVCISDVSGVQLMVSLSGLSSSLSDFI